MVETCEVPTKGLQNCGGRHAKLNYTSMITPQAKMFHTNQVPITTSPLISLITTTAPFTAQRGLGLGFNGLGHKILARIVPNILFPSHLHSPLFSIIVPESRTGDLCSLDEVFEDLDVKIMYSRSTEVVKSSASCEAG